MASLEQQRVADVWEALRVTALVILAIGVSSAVAALLLALVWLGHPSVGFIALVTMSLVILALPFIRRVWRVNERGIVIDRLAGTLTFPAADVENSLADILTLVPFFNLGRAESVPLTAIRDITNDTLRASSTTMQRPHRDRFALNIMGSFGSRQLAFSSKQKRDEFRSALQGAMRSRQIGRDVNVDFPS